MLSDSTAAPSITHQLCQETDECRLPHQGGLASHVWPRYQHQWAVGVLRRPSHHHVIGDELVRHGGQQARVQPIADLKERLRCGRKKTISLFIMCPIIYI